MGLAMQAEAQGSKRKSKASKESNFKWEGLGADTPTQVSGLGAVHAVALGGKHALALVEA